MAAEIAEKALTQAGIQECSDDLNTTSDQNYSLYYRENDNNYFLTIIIHYQNASLTSSIIHTSLSTIVLGILDEIILLLSSPKLRTYLNVKDSDLKKLAFQKTLHLTTIYISYLPIVIHHSFIQTLKETIIGDLKKFVEPELREYWNELGLPQTFTFCAENNLAKLINFIPKDEPSLLRRIEIQDRDYSKFRSLMIGGRKAFFTKEALAALPETYKNLQNQYKKAKHEYKVKKAAYFALHRRAGLEDWKNFWKEYFDEEFTELFINDVEFDTPSELAQKQLADVYGFSRTYIVKLITGKEQTKEGTISKKG